MINFNVVKIRLKNVLNGTTDMVIKYNGFKSNTKIPRNEELIAEAIKKIPFSVKGSWKNKLEKMEKMDNHVLSKKYQNELNG